MKCFAPYAWVIWSARLGDGNDDDEKEEVYDFPAILPAQPPPSPSKK